MRRTAKKPEMAVAVTIFAKLQTKVFILDE